MSQDLNIDNYTYDLPGERIAKFPLADRSSSKLLVYKNRSIDHRKFSGISELLPRQSLLVFNNTRVIPARIRFVKGTGARIEILLLEPVAPSNIVSQAMEAKGECVWQCMIGNRKKWRGESLMKAVSTNGKNLHLKAELVDSIGDLIRFGWDDSNYSFGDIVQSAGQMPLPPYLNREVVDNDYQTYQTVYAKREGAVAAPTAGLHFTSEIIDQLKRDGHSADYLTLHVGAGTFQPMKTKMANDHEMHSEQIVITKKNLVNLIEHSGSVVPVGTTSSRTLESIYWMGTKLTKNPAAEFSIDQSDPFEYSGGAPCKNEALEAVLEAMKRRKLDTIVCKTSIFIYPGYQFRMCDALITNSHQPGSTLILLIAAFAGNSWRKIYNEALMEGYRFLSYGDCSLIIP